MLILRRSKNLLTVAFKHALAYWLGPTLCRLSWFRRNLPDGTLPTPERLRIFLEDLGGAFIKFGQMLALQPDVVPLEYCNALFNLMDRISAFDYSLVERTFLEEFGRKPSEIFTYFDKHPLATASIGQVHVAYLNGDKLAVKVQRPEVQKEFAGDIHLMKMAIRLITFLHLQKLYWMIEPMSEFIRWTQEELDYRREARYMDRLHKNARDNANERVPVVVWEYTTSRTLVAEFFEGTTVLNYLRAIDAGDRAVIQPLKERGFSADAVARRIIDNFLTDAFRHGMFHADLHPANLMILPGNVVGYVDFGITGVLSH
ncbi:MAG TPA: AarF/UbiB family protein, partial [Terriglobia bacterium]|nr:AarF/UbiB family protein [Terriglobia bacterium]